jgi:tRNA-specific 2-thiouridylase
VFVTKIDAEENAVVIGPRDQLGVSRLVLEEVSFTGRPPEAPTSVMVQHRAHGEVARATLLSDAVRAYVRYHQPVEAVAPGQSAAFYDSRDPDELIGGGIIAETVAATAVA